MSRRTASRFPPALESAERYEVLNFYAGGGWGKSIGPATGNCNREVALKRIRKAYAGDPTSRSQFVMEAEVTGGLEHPGIVPVYSLGNPDNAEQPPFYAMRFIRGENLWDATRAFHKSMGDKPAERRGAFASIEFRQLLNRFVDVCNAIEYAHSRGVLHRDIKPANVMLGPYGETLVVDWGLACVWRPAHPECGRRASVDDSHGHSPDPR